MKKTNRNTKRKLGLFVAIFLVAIVQSFVSCEKDEESAIGQSIEESSIIGDYSRFDAIMVNSDNGTPQRFESLEAYLGDELQLLDDGSFKSTTLQGNWTKEGAILFLYPQVGSSINFEIEEMDGQILELSNRYESYDAYSDGTITYTFIKKGGEVDYDNDLLSSFKTWLEEL